MKRFLKRGGLGLALFAVLALLAGGCGKKDEAKNGDKDKEVAKKDDKKPEEKGGHDGWWCDEHGLPEHDCDLCHRKFREAEKAKGNWCEHNRVKTSCFKCNPGLREKYAAEYRAKFNMEPPPIDGDEKPAKDKK